MDDNTKDTTARKRNFCFTLNNWTENEYDAICKTLKFKYLIIGKEIGESGTPHLQGFYILKNASTLKAQLKNKWRWHVEVCLGTIPQNIAYCMKGGDFKEFGEIPKGDGKRTDIDVVKKMVKSGANIKQIYEECTSYQAFKFAEVGMHLYAPKRKFKTKVYWFWGPTGTGKSKTAFEMFPDAYWADRSNGFWNGYENQEAVIIDDFRCDFMKFHEMLKLFDRYPYVINTKGSFREFNSKFIVLTTPKNPEETWAGRGGEDLKQLLRRIDEIREFTQTLDTEVGGNTGTPTLEIDKNDLEIDKNDINIDN